MDFVEIFNVLLDRLLVVIGVELLLCLAINSTLKCYNLLNLFSGVKLSIRSSFII